MNKDLIIQPNKSLKDAMLKINKNAIGIIFIVDSKKKLLGVLTDGDIRRAILKGINIFSTCKNLMKKKFIYIRENTMQSSALNLLQKYRNHIKVFPIIDKNRKLLDYATSDRLNFIPIYYPNLRGNELKYLSKCITDNWISSNGLFVKKFEKKFSNLHQKRHSLTVSNGSVAIHLSLAALGIKKGDEIIIPNLTFAAVINSVLNIGATPVPVDVDINKWTIDPSEIKKNITKKTKAVIVVHFLGNPCDLKKISNICKKEKIFLIEDCAEAIGSKFNGEMVGNYGDCSTYSFFGNKTITTGEGGMITFKNKNIFEKANILRDHGMSKKKRYYHEEIGYNYRMTNMQAAIGLAQLEQFKKIIKEKINIFNTYKKFLKHNNSIKFQVNENRSLNSYWLVGIKFKKNTIDIEKLQKKLLKNGIETRNFFYPFSLQKIYSKVSKSKSEVSEEIYKNSIMLPSFPGIKKLEIKFISKILNKYLK